MRLARPERSRGWDTSTGNKMDFGLWHPSAVLYLRQSACGSEAWNAPQRLSSSAVRGLRKRRDARGGPLKGVSHVIYMAAR